MEIREISILALGVIMLGIGVAILAIFGDSGFFVFPFFFVGASGVIPFFVIFSLTIMVLFFWWANSQYTEDARFVKYTHPREEFLKIGGLCQNCGSPIPQKAAFCSVCGSEVEIDLSEDDSF
ncbi:MAG: zinc-ribbon domain-containing protein [Candidatus Thorarchaeota archaeon]